jgi:BirA family biotin operon repressor/biotin-[acetyl-CoA-carboxylase] ligase
VTVSTSELLGSWLPVPGGRRNDVAEHSWLSRLEWLDRVGSTNDVVMGWLRGGTREVCVAIADEQSAGRGRSGRRWTAPAGAAILASVGFTPSWLPPERAWQLAAIVSIAMAEACERVTGAPSRTIRLKWPNDLVVRFTASGQVRKLAGVLGETADHPDAGRIAVVGIGVNADWARVAFPPELAPSMTSLRELVDTDAGNHPAIDREALVDGFLAQLDPLVALLRSGVFPAGSWQGRQLTNGLLVRLEWPDGTAETVEAVDVDPESGALLVRDPGRGTARRVSVGEIRHLRLDGSPS